MLVLNEGQKKAYEGFQEWLPKSIKEAPVALLNGAAGTGKTTIVTWMARLAQIMGWCVRGAAKTCKAAAVLHEKGGLITSSVASLLNGGGSLETQLHGKGLLIVDEASMIDDIDLTNILKLAADMGYKVLLIGDGCQLPPIADEQNVRGREIVFRPGLTPYTWKLSQVMRQTGKSGVLAYATAIRGAQKVLKPPCTGMKDIRVIRSSDLINDYVSALKQGEHVMMIDAGNTDRKYHNEKIRRTLGENREIQLGETLVALRNIKDDNVYVIQNSTTWTATTQLRYEHTGTYTVCYYDGGTLKKEKVHLHFVYDFVYNDKVGYETEFPVIIADSLPIPSWHNAWFCCNEWPTDIRQQYCYKPIKAEEKAKAGTAPRDNWVLQPKVIVGTFGYSLTCHKAQGSQADTVYIASGSQDWRWFYTAVTRAAKRLVLTDGVLEQVQGDTYSSDQIFQMAEEYGQKADSESRPDKYMDMDLALEVAKYHTPIQEQYVPQGEVDKIITGMLQHVQAGARKFSNDGLHLLAMANLLRDPRYLEDLVKTAKKLPAITDYRQVTTEESSTLYKTIYACTKTEAEYGYAAAGISEYRNPLDFDKTLQIFVQEKDGYIGYGYSCGLYFWYQVEKAITLEEAYERVVNEVAGLPEELSLTIEGHKNLERFTQLRQAVWKLSEREYSSNNIDDKLFAAITLNEQKNGDYRNESHKETASDKITVVTDGSCSGNPGPAGWAFATYTGIQKSGFIGDKSTNNAAELTAVIEAIKAFPDTELEIHTDSAYVLNTVSGTWTRNTNLELWAAFDEVSAGRQITYVKVRGGHGKNDTDPFEPLHDTVDELAKAAAKAGRLPESEEKFVPLTDPRIAELEKQLAERDAKITQITAERDKAIAERDAAIEQFKEERTRADKTAADLKAFNKRFADFLFAQ